MTDPSVTDASAPSGASVAIPDAAFEAAGVAAADVFGKWYYKPNRDAYVTVACGQSARKGVQAAAPLIIAAELERLAAFFKADANEESKYTERLRREHTEYWRIESSLTAERMQRAACARLTARAKELRGETS